MKRRTLWLLALAWLVSMPAFAAAQSLTGALVGTVKDEQGGVLTGARARMTSPALIGGPVSAPTDDRGQFRFPALAPGTYVLEVERQGFATHRQIGLRIAAGATIEASVALKVAGPSEVVAVEAGAPLEARGSGFDSRLGADYFAGVPNRRTSVFDSLRASPGISPTSPSSATATTVSVFGSATGENLFLIDGTNTTCPCNGIARSELGVDFISEVQVQSIGASAEFGNMQGAVFNVVTKQGSGRLRSDASYYGQWAALTSQPTRLPFSDSETGYERDRYRDGTFDISGAAIPDRLWYFGGYQYLRDYDSQPGTNPATPRVYEQNKIFGKLTWRLTPSMRLSQSVHTEFWVNPDTPTSVTPFEATRRRSATVPAITFAQFTHTPSPSLVWDARLARFTYVEDRDPSTGDWTIPSRFDRVTGVTTGAPPLVGGLTLIRTTGKATLSYFRPNWLNADHQWKVGGEVEQGEQRGANVIPTGVRFVDNNGQPFQSVSSAPSNTGGMFVTAAAFVTDTVTLGNRVTVNAGLRFDHSRAIGQDVPAIDATGEPADGVVTGRGTMYTWNVWSPRLGVTARLTADGRTLVRASYGRYHQGVLTGELTPFHPGVTPVRTDAYDPLTGGYTRLVRVVDPLKNLAFDPETRSPYTDEYSVSVDREVRRELVVSGVYVHKRGRDFIGWTDVGGLYVQTSRTLPDGRVIPVHELVNSTADQVFRLDNQDNYFLKYDGFVLAAERRRTQGWWASGSYTYSRVTGLMASSGATAAAPQTSTVAQPTMVFGRDPNDLTNAVGRLPNDRPHAFRLMGSLDVPRTGIVVAGSVQHFSGKPWAATAQVLLPQGDQRILLEPRGTRRLSSQTLMDVRVSRAFQVSRATRLEVLLDILNLLNDTAEESIVADDQFSPNFGQPTLFMDPRRAMIGARFRWGQ